MRYLIILLLGLYGASLQADPHRSLPHKNGAQDDQAAKGSSRYAQSDGDSRGKMLYENHCRVCHDSTVHIRENHKAKSPDDIRYWATRWSKYLKLDWGSDEIDVVVDHLSKTYYHFQDSP